MVWSHHIFLVHFTNYSVVRMILKHVTCAYGKFRELTILCSQIGKTEFFLPYSASENGQQSPIGDRRYILFSHKIYQIQVLQIVSSLFCPLYKYICIYICKTDFLLQEPVYWLLSNPICWLNKCEINILHFVNMLYADHNITAIQVKCLYKVLY